MRKSPSKPFRPSAIPPNTMPALCDSCLTDLAIVSLVIAEFADDPAISVSCDFDLCDDCCRWAHSPKAQKVEKADFLRKVATRAFFQREGQGGGFSRSVSRAVSTALREAVQ